MILKSNSGFTLVELIVTLIVAGFLFMLLSLVSINDYRQLIFVEGNVDIAQQADLVFSRIHVELDNMTDIIFDNDGGTCKFIEGQSYNCISYKTQEDSSEISREIGFNNRDNILYLYNYNSTILSCNRPKCACGGEVNCNAPLATNVTDFSIKYYTKDYVEGVPKDITDKANIYKIIITLTLKNQHNSNTFDFYLKIFPDFP